MLNRKIFVALLFAWMGLTGTASAQGEKLFESMPRTSATAASEKKISAITNRNQSKEFGLFKFRPSALEAKKLVLDLPDGRTVTLERRIFTKHQTHISFAASSAADQVDVTLVTSGTKVSGSILTQYGSYSVDSIDDADSYIISQTDKSTIPKNIPNAERPIPPPELERREKEFQEERRKREGRSKSTDTTSRKQDGAVANLSPGPAVVIEAMAQYTAAARNALGSDAAVTSAIRNAFTQANLTFAHSDVNIQLNLVDIQLTDFNESGLNIGQSLNTWAPRTDVGLRRNVVGADVSFLIAFPSFGASCGESYAGPASGLAYSAVNVGCLVTYFSLAHEFGHLLGADHNIGASQAPLTLTGSAHGFPGANDSLTRTYNGQNYTVCYNTIMAYPVSVSGCFSDSKTQVTSYWSSTTTPVPFNLSAGTAYWYLGSATAMNDAKLNSTALTVASFRGASNGTPGGGEGGSETDFIQKIFNWLYQQIGD